MHTVPAISHRPHRGWFAPVPQTRARRAHRQEVCHG